MKRPLTNTLSVAGADALSRLLGFFVAAYLARVVGVDAFGLLSIGTAVLSYLLTLSSPGLHVLGTRNVAAQREGFGSLPEEIVSLRALLAVLLLAVTAVGCFALVDSTLSRGVIMVIAASGLPLALSVDWYFQGRERLAIVSTGKIVMYLAYLTLVLVLVTTSRDVIQAAAAYFVANCIAVLWLLVTYIKEGGKLRIGWMPDRWQALLKDALPLGISFMLAQTITNLPVLLVGALQSGRAAGYFSAAMKLVFFVLLADRVLFAVFFPVTSRYARTGADELGRIVALGARVVLLICVPITIAGVVFAPQAVSMVYGQSYAESVPSLRWLMVYFLATVTNTVFMCTMISQDREREFTKIMAVGTGFLVLLCLLLPTWFGIAGTSAGVALGEAAMTGMLVWALRKTVHIAMLGLFFPFFAGGVGMVAVVYSMSSLHPILLLPLSLVVFGAIALLLGGLPKKELLFLRERFV